MRTHAVSPAAFFRSSLDTVSLRVLRKHKAKVRFALGLVASASEKRCSQHRPFFNFTVTSPPRKERQLTDIW